MKLNQFVWNNYKESKEGQEVIKLFEEGSYEEMLNRFVDFKNKSIDNYLYLIDVLQNPKNKIVINEDDNDAQVLSDTFNFYINNGIVDEDEEGEFVLIEKGDIDSILNLVEPISLFLFTVFPDFFTPYLFQMQMLKLQKICDTFGIILPQIPLRKNKQGRWDFYFQFCEIFNEFKEVNGLTPFELCAFLYDFAPKFIGDETTEILPAPTTIWLCGASKDDYADLLNATDKTKYFWQGNEDAKTGDIVVMYCLAPRSGIEFISRATNNGIRDPFFHFYGSITLGNFQKIPPIHISEMRNDIYLKQLSIVKSNFQGVNGTRLNNEDYKRILEILKVKGQDISVLPQLSSIDFQPNSDCKNEREVEIKIVEPFLNKIGYEENDWVRQLSVRMGRCERNYPDYVFFANENKGYESGKMLLETKFLIKSNRDLEETFQQAHSYALRLNSRIIVIADKDFIWIYTRKNESFDRTKYIKYNWQEMNNPDVFNSVKKLLGKDFLE